VENINNKIVKGAAWMLFLRLSVKSIGFVSTLVLARLLIPEDFGIVALAMSIFALIELIQGFSFGVALIQNQQATNKHFDTAWTLQLLFGLVAGLLILSVSAPVSTYYDEPKLFWVLNFMSLLFVIDGFKNIGIIFFQKDMEFHKEFKFGIIVKLVGFFVTIPLAFCLRSYWALLLGMLSLSMTTVILSYTMQAYRPTFTLNKSKELFGFSSWLLLNNILFYIGNNAQNFLLAKHMGLGSLGIFNISNEISTLTTAEIVAPINKAAYPAYSKVAKALEKLRETYLNVLSGIALIAIPSAVGISAVAPVLIPVMLGDKWLEAIAIVQLIALASAIQAINTNSSYVYLAIARQKINTLLIIIRLSILLSLMVHYVTSEGIYGVAKAILITQIIMMPMSQFILKFHINLSLLGVLNVLYRPIISSAMMYAILYGLVESHHYVNASLDAIVYLIYLVLVGLVTYIASTGVLWLLAGRPACLEVSFFFKLKTLLKNKLQTL